MGKKKASIRKVAKTHPTKKAKHKKTSKLKPTAKKATSKSKRGGAKTSTRAGTSKGRKQAVGYAKAVRVLDKYRSHFEGLGGKVKGVGIGYRFKKDKLTNELVITLEVRTLSDKRWLLKKKKELNYRKRYDGIDTDIVVRRDFKTIANGTGAAVGELPAGTSIVGPGGRGRLGAKVIIEADGADSGVWLTVAHAASNSTTDLGSDSVIIRKHGTNAPIGTISRKHFFRNSDVDVAFIVPAPPISLTIPTPRTVAPPEVGMEVSVDGSNAKGKVIVMNYNGPIVSPGGPETVVDHFQVQGLEVAPGHSGSCIVQDRRLLGIIRGAVLGQDIAICTRLDNVQVLAMDFQAR